MGEVEEQLRNDQASFADVRALSPTGYRFRVVDANGIDIRYSGSSVYGSTKDSYQYPITRSEDTRVFAPRKLGEGGKKGRRSGNLETFGFEPDRYSILSGKGWSPAGTECCVGRGDAHCEAYTGSA